MKRLMALVILVGVTSSALAERVTIQRRDSEPPVQNEPSGGAPSSPSTVEPSGPSLPSTPRRTRIQRRDSSPAYSSPSRSVPASVPNDYQYAPSGSRTRIVPRSNTVESTGTPPQRTHIIRNPNVINHIESQRHYETRPHHYYWHRVGGSRYCHYYDGGAHWYGFYNGPSFYWTRYHGGNWWWLDVNYNRWNYWHNGYWWWPAPGGVTYVYVDQNYVQPDDVGLPPPTTSTPAEQEKAKDTSSTSPDRTRMVQVVGAKSEAFLYDVTKDQTSFLGYLGQDVSNVRFSGGTEGKPLRILIDFKNGSFALFDQSGKPLEGPTLPGERTPPPTPPQP